MKKILIFCIALFAIVLVTGRADFDKAPATLTLNDGSTTFNCTLTGMMYAGNYIYTATMDPPGNALVFFDQTWMSFVIKVFEDAFWWGFTYEGHWTGNCSTGYAINNNDGSTWTASICHGPAPSPAPDISHFKRK